MNPNQPIKSAAPGTGSDSKVSSLTSSNLPGRTSAGTLEAAQNIDRENPRLLPSGQHPGFENLKSKPGVYRCRLRPELAKRDPRHADYKGVSPLTGSKALILLLVHEDGTLGLRLEKITSKPAGGKLQN